MHGSVELSSLGKALTVGVDPEFVLLDPWLCTPSGIDVNLATPSKKRGL